MSSKGPSMRIFTMLRDQVWEEISMDFVEGLPRILGKSTIVVIVDKLTKFAHFLPLSPIHSQASSYLLHR